jgi:hypothetical protein
MFIILAFKHALTRMGMAVNVGLFVSTLLKTANACWTLAVNSDKHRTMLKWINWIWLGELSTRAGKKVFFSLVPMTQGPYIKDFHYFFRIVDPPSPTPTSKKRPNVQTPPKKAVQQWPPQKKLNVKMTFLFLYFASWLHFVRKSSKRRINNETKTAEMSFEKEKKGFRLLY